MSVKATITIMESTRNFFVGIMKNDYKMILIDKFKVENEDDFKLFVSNIGCFYIGTIKTIDHDTIAVVMVPNKFSFMYLTELLEYDGVNCCFNGIDVFNSAKKSFNTNKSREFRKRLHDQHIDLFKSIFD